MILKVNSFRLVAILLCFGFSVNNGFASGDPIKRTYSTTEMTTSAPEIDGVLDDSVWNTGFWQGEFTQQIPEEGAKPSKETKVKVTYDYENMYVAIFCYDTPDNIRQIFTKRDRFGGDVVGIAFDSYFNQRTAYEFNLSAAGQKIDLMHTGEGNIDFNWNSNWEGMTAISDSGWSAEFRIPFSQLRYNNINEQTWGMHVWRWIDNNKEEDQWTLLPVKGPPGVHNFGQINGISNIRSSRQVEFLPYVSTKVERTGDNDNPYISDTKVVPNAGIDMKMGLSSNFTLDATINPDFGQVEADPSELNLSAYETFYREKRPFFLEGRDIFKFSVNGDQLFYSRRIGASPRYSPDIDDGEYYESPENIAILGSAKITGRTANGISVGILETITNNEFGSIYRPNGEEGNEKERIKVEPLTSYFASRIKKETNDANTIIGGSFNSVARKLNDDYLQEEFVAYANTAGVDFMQYFNSKNYYVQLNGMYSNLVGSENAITQKQESHIHRFQRSDAEHLTLDTTRTNLTGTSGYFEIGKNGGNFLFESNIGYWSPQLNINDIGFMKEADYIEQENEVTYRETEPGNVFRNYRIEIQNTNKWSFGGEHTHSGLESKFVGQFNNLWTLFAEGGKVFPSLDPRVLRGGPALYNDGYYGGGVWMQTNSSNRFYINLSGFYYGNAKNNSTHKSTGVSFNYNPINKLRLTLRSRFMHNNYAEEFFNSDLSDINVYTIGRMNQKELQFTIRAEYYIRPEISFQYYGNPFFSVVDYSSLRRVEEAGAKNSSDRFYVYTEGDEITFNAEDNYYYVNEYNGASYSFENPDVSYGNFQSNFVFRWEYKLGSVFYFVWSHNQSEYTNVNSPHLDKPINELFSTPSGDAVMVKLSYWFNV